MVYTAIDERREQILDAAIDVIAREGLQKATNRRIAEKAGIPLGLITYCFENKDAMLAATMERTNARMADWFADVDVDNGLERCLNSMTHRIWAWMQYDPNFQLAIYELSIWSVRNDGSTTTDYYGPSLQTFADLAWSSVTRAPRTITRARIAEVVEFIIAGLDGIFLQHMSSPNKDYTTHVADVAAAAGALVAVRKRRT